MFKFSGIILEWKKSPTLKINTGGAPKEVFTALLYWRVVPPWLSTLTVGMVSPGLIHCCKKVSLAFKPSGVIEWKAG